MVKFNIFESEFHRLCCMQMRLMELYSSDIISLDDFNDFNSRIIDRLYDLESEVKTYEKQKDV